MLCNFGVHNVLGEGEGEERNRFEHLYSLLIWYQIAMCDILNKDPSTTQLESPSPIFSLFWRPFTQLAAVKFYSLDWVIAAINFT